MQVKVRDGRRRNAIDVVRPLYDLIARSPDYSTSATIQKWIDVALMMVCIVTIADALAERVQTISSYISARGPATIGATTN